MPFHAVYFDGVEAQKHPVTAYADSRHLVIALDGRNILWPLDKITLEQYPQDGVVGIFGRNEDSDEVLHITSKSDFDALLAQLPQKSRFVFGWKIPLSLMALMVALIYLVVYVIPSLAYAFTPLIPYRYEQFLGKKIYPLIAGDKRICSTEQGDAALAALVQKFAPPHPVSIHVFDTHKKNAYALPGGTIVVFRGLIEQAKTADELAGVIAHEMGHLEERHSLQRLVRTLGTGLVIDVFTGGGGTLVYAASLVNDLHYSREQEEEADTHALALLYEEHINPEALATFFGRVQGEHPLLEGDLEFLSTHPAPANRAAAIQRLQKEGNRQYYPALTKQQWKALSHICDTPSADAPID